MRSRLKEILDSKGFKYSFIAKKHQFQIQL